MYYLSSTGFVVRSREISLELHVVFISSTLQIKRAKRQERVRERKKIKSVEFFFLVRSDPWSYSAYQGDKI